MLDQKELPVFAVVALMHLGDKARPAHLCPQDDDQVLLPQHNLKKHLRKSTGGSWELFLYCTECSSRSTGAPARPMVTHSWSCYRLVRCIQLNTVTMRKGNVLQVQSALHRNVLVIADMATMRHETPRSCLAPYTKLKYSVCVISHSFFL